MRLTKDQRHTAYIILLAELEERQREGWYPFLCNIIGSLWGTDLHITDLYELWNRRPNRIDKLSSEAWYKTFNYNSRISILKNCIKETSPK